MSGLHTLGTNDPSNSPSRESESLGKTVDDQDVIFVDILDVLGSGNGGSVAVAGVVVARVKLVADECGTATANVLDLCKLGVGDDAAGRVSGVGGKNDRGTAGDFLGNLVGVNVVAIFLGQRDGNGSKLNVLVSSHMTFYSGV